MVVLWERVEKAVTDDDDDDDDDADGKRHLLSSQPSTMVAAKNSHLNLTDPDRYWVEC